MVFLFLGLMPLIPKWFHGFFPLSPKVGLHRADTLEDGDIRHEC
jgi:hypothetical protein